MSQVASSLSTENPATAASTGAASAGGATGPRYRTPSEQGSASGGHLVLFVMLFILMWLVV